MYIYIYIHTRTHINTHTYIHDYMYMYNPEDGNRVRFMGLGKKNCCAKSEVHNYEMKCHCISLYFILCRCIPIMGWIRLVGSLK